VTTRETLDRYFTALHAGEGWQDLLADGMVFTSFTTPVRQVVGRDSFVTATRGFYSMIRSFELRDLMVDGNRACALTRYELRPPSGPAFVSDVAEVFEVTGNSIARFDIYFDSSPYPK